MVNGTQGNDAFGPVPIELEPTSLDEAGLIRADIVSGLRGAGVDELGGERSIRGRGVGLGLKWEEEGEGEGSTMDIEDD